LEGTIIPYDGEPTWKVTFTRNEMRGLIDCLQIVAEGFQVNLTWYKRHTKGWEGADYIAECGQEAHDRAREFQDRIVDLARQNGSSFDLEFTKGELFDFGSFQSLAAKFYRGVFPWPWGGVRARRAMKLFNKVASVLKGVPGSGPILDPSWMVFIKTVDMLRS
jgi:hypothetical protein